MTKSTSCVVIVNQEQLKNTPLKVVIGCVEGGRTSGTSSTFQNVLYNVCLLINIEYGQVIY